MYVSVANKRRDNMAKARAKLVKPIHVLEVRQDKDGQWLDAKDLGVMESRAYKQLQKKGTDAVKYMGRYTDSEGYEEWLAFYMEAS